MDTDKNIEGNRKLKELRTLMESRGYGAYVVPHEDRHDVSRMF
jgi:hypothetical protein